MSESIQFDSSETIIGGVNIAEAIISDKKLIFNESYTVTGESLVAPSLYACYDLTVIGDVEVDDIEVCGNFRVIGDIKARKRLSCLKGIFCSGDIDADSISGSDIVADNIKCTTLSCTGNVIARTTIDVGESVTVDKSVMTGEGIVGSGNFSARNAVAAEYFEFVGDVRGKALELDTDASFGEPHEEATADKLTLEELFETLKGKVQERLAQAGEVDEDQLLSFIEQLSAIDIDLLSDWRKLTGKLVDISYLDQITNLRDYLYVIMATKILPEEIIAYETIEHVFDNLLEDAETRLSSMEFHAKDVEDFAYSLKIVTLCENEIRMDRDEMLDHIFQSVGIKYKTVQGFLG